MMDNFMDILEIKEMKRNIEEQIKKIILDFEEKSRVFVKDIYLERSNIVVIGSDSEKRNIKIHIECRI